MAAMLMTGIVRKIVFVIESAGHLNGPEAHHGTGAENLAAKYPLVLSTCRHSLYRLYEQRQCCQVSYWWKQSLAAPFTTQLLLSLHTVVTMHASLYVSISYYCQQHIHLRSTPGGAPAAPLPAAPVRRGWLGAPPPPPLVP